MLSFYKEPLPHLEELKALEIIIFELYFDDWLFNDLSHELWAVHRVMLSTIDSAHKLLEKEKAYGEKYKHAEHYDVAIPWAETQYHLVAPATAIVILVCFLEKALKQVYYDAFRKKFKKKKQNRTTVNELLVEIYAIDDRGISHLNLDTLSVCLKLRNQFAHGEWEELEAKLVDFRFTAVFDEVLDLLHDMESLCRDLKSKGLMKEWPSFYDDEPGGD
jgi:hypothetical protein